jgi:hypothetical protein
MFLHDSLCCQGAHVIGEADADLCFLCWKQHILIVQLLSHDHALIGNAINNTTLQSGFLYGYILRCQLGVNGNMIRSIFHVNS